MDMKGAVDLAILLGQIEERIIMTDEWKALRDADPQLWEACNDGYESVAVFINRLHDRISEVY